MNEKMGSVTNDNHNHLSPTPFDMWQGRVSEKRWMINGRRIGLSELVSALKVYWEGIASKFPDVEAIGVITIDIAMRAQACDS